MVFRMAKTKPPGVVPDGIAEDEMNTTKYYFLHPIPYNKPICYSARQR
jgi:hypothetical protein